jgi:phage shock protein PspC (stress-responsive transcriptional regulator)
MKKIICLFILCTFFITACGNVIPVPTKENPKVRLTLIPSPENVIGGVCAGFAYWTGTPTWIWRAGFIVFTLAGGSGILAYLIAWIIMPKYQSVPKDFYDRTQ